MRNLLNYIYKAFAIILFAVAIVDVANAQQEKIYTVKQGDTFYSISKALDVTVAELKEWNNVTGNNLEIGQELIYYVQEEAEAQSDSVAVPEDNSTLINAQETASNTYYLVKSGDTLYKIARDNDMTIQELKELNNLTSDNLRIGQRLAVKSVSVAPVVSEFSNESSPQGKFALYTLTSSDNLESILDRFEMTRAELKALNPQINIDNLNLAKNITVLLPPSRSFENPYLEKADLQDLGSVSALVYADDEIGKATTNGELYNPDKLTAAHSNISIGSIIFVENSENGKGIYVRVNDRITNSGLKLSHTAYRILGMVPEKNQDVTIYTGES